MRFLHFSKFISDTSSAGGPHPELQDSRKLI